MQQYLRFLKIYVKCCLNNKPKHFYTKLIKYITVKKYNNHQQ